MGKCRRCLDYMCGKSGICPSCMKSWTNKRISTYNEIKADVGNEVTKENLQKIKDDLKLKKIKA